jgi:hypothetical protein
MCILTPKQQEWAARSGNVYPPQCKECGNVTAWNSSKAEFRLYCSKRCAIAGKADQQEKQRQTNRERYGADYAHQTDEVKAKIKQAAASKSNTDKQRQQEKQRQTNRERYGADYAHQTDEVKAKIKQTFVNRYGGHPSTNNVVKQNRINTFIKRFGVDNPRKAELVKAKIQESCIATLGVRTPFQLPEHKVVARDEMLARFGYDVLYDMYVLQQLPAQAIARTLGVDTSTILRHLHAHNIDIDNKRGTSRIATVWLTAMSISESCNIRHVHNGGEYVIPGTRYHVDGYCAETNTVYEFYGDYWHGNPKIYEASDMNATVGISMGELYQQTTEREETIRNLGYNVITMWECDYYDR